MSLEEAISMGPVKEKLRNLQDYMPGKNVAVYQFGAYLADKLNPSLIPPGFVQAAGLALHELKTGFDQITNESIRNELVGYQPFFYDVLSMHIPGIARAVCPEDFANGVQVFCDSVNSRIS